MNNGFIEDGCGRNPQEKRAAEEEDCHLRRKLSTGPQDEKQCQKRISSLALEKDSGLQASQFKQNLENLDVIRKQANALCSRERYEEALVQYDKLLMTVCDEDILVAKGICLLKLGKRQEGFHAFSSALKMNGQNVKALIGCGEIYKISDRLQDAIQYFREALKVENDNPIARDALAITLTESGTRMKLIGNVSQAIEQYKEATEIQPTCGAAHYNLGVIYGECGTFDDALDSYRRALEQQYNSPETYNNIAVILRTKGDIASAIHCYHLALDLNPNYILAKNNLAAALLDMGTALRNEGKRQEALVTYEKALFFSTRSPEIFYNLGITFSEMGETQRAIINYQLAIELNSRYAEAHNNLGVLYKDMENYDAALTCYSRAIEHRPAFPEALNNLAVIYTMHGNFEKAHANLQGALTIHPNYIEALINMGKLFQDAGEIDTAISWYERCLSPLRLGNPEEVSHLAPRIRNAAHNYLFALNYTTIESAVVSKCHQELSSLLFGSLTPQASHTNPRESDRMLHIGFISPDFCIHSVAFFIEGPLRYFKTAQRIKVTCYHSSRKNDVKTRQLKELSHQWRDIPNHSAEEAAKLIVKDEIDILIELTGHTANNRLDVLALKPAPIQITWIGYPNTTGLKTVDYRITDKYADPETSTQSYIEKLVHFDRCFLCYTPPKECKEVITTEPPCLESGFVTFGTFNNLAKLQPNVLRAWARILNAVPNSRLMLKSRSFTSETVRERITSFLNAHGVSSARIDLLNVFASTKDHLHAYRMMDIALDTWPYAGTTTTCEALYMGVPVITLASLPESSNRYSHAQNVGRTLLVATGLQELIAYEENEYIEKAIQLSADTDRLKVYRTKLQEKVEKSPLCDIESFGNELETKLRVLWEHWVNQQQQQSEICENGTPSNDEKK